MAIIHANFSIIHYVLNIMCTGCTVYTRNNNNITYSHEVVCYTYWLLSVTSKLGVCTLWYLVLIKYKINHDANKLYF